MESEIDSKWLHQEETNLKKRLSLFTTTGTIDIDSGNSGPQSIGSFPVSGNQSKFSPQNSISGPQSLNEQCPSTPNSATDSRPHTPGSNQGTLKSKNLSMERCTTPTQASNNIGIATVGDEKVPGIKKTLQLDRENDRVYESTTNVVKAIMSLTQGAEKPAEYLDLVKNIGVELRTLLSSVDQLTTSFPPQAHKYISLLI